MRLTINTDDPDKVVNAAMAATAFIAKYLPHDSRRTHRDCVFYTPDGSDRPWPYEMHVWGNSDHVRVFVYTAEEQA